MVAPVLDRQPAVEEIAEFLARTSAFAALPADVLDSLAAQVAVVSFAAGHNVVRQGEPGDGIYVVMSGQVEVLLRGADRPLAMLSAGEVFGEQALLSGEPRSATVRAVEPVELLRVGRSVWTALLSRFPECRRYFVRLALQRQRPARVDGWEMVPQRGRDGSNAYVLKGGGRRGYALLSEEGAFLWALMDGQRTVRDLTIAYHERYHRFGLPTVLETMVLLHEAGLVRVQQIVGLSCGPTTRAGRLAGMLAPWTTRYVAVRDVDRPVTWLYRSLLWPLYRRPAQLLLLATAVAGALLFAALAATGAPAASAVLEPGILWLVIALGIMLQGSLHELAHAVTCKHVGREIHRVGVGWYLFLPVAFVDTSDSWLADRRQRAAVAFAGPYTNLVLSGLATLLIPLAPDVPTQAVLFQVAALGYLIGLMGLNPLLESDGYHILTDWLGIPNLRMRALAFLGTRLTGGRATPYEHRLGRIYVLFGGLTLVYTTVIALLVLAVYGAWLTALVSWAAPDALAAFLGWLIGGLMGGLLLLRTWGEMRRIPGRVPRATSEL